MLCDLEAWSETIGLGSLPISPTVPTSTADGDAKHPQRRRQGPQRDRVDSELLGKPCKRDPRPCRAKRQASSTQ